MFHNAILGKQWKIPYGKYATNQQLIDSIVESINKNYLIYANIFTKFRLHKYAKLACVKVKYEST